MKEQLISFETAKLAKEKGFNEPCHSHYTQNRPEKKEELFTLSEVESLNTWNGRFSAPTQSLLQKWLREKKGLVIEVGFDWLETGKWNCSVITKKVVGAFYATDAIHVDSYEEALETGLKTALELIENNSQPE